MKMIAGNFSERFMLYYHGSPYAYSFFRKEKKTYFVIVATISILSVKPLPHHLPFSMYTGAVCSVSKILINFTDYEKEIQK